MSQTIESIGVQLETEPMSRVHLEQVDGNSIPFGYTGYGDSFIRFIETDQMGSDADGVDLAAALSVKVIADATVTDPDTTGEFTFEDVPVAAQVYVRGRLIGGITQDGRHLQTSYLEFADSIVGEFESAVQQDREADSRFDPLRTERIFLPKLKGFDARGLDYNERYKLQTERIRAGLAVINPKEYGHSLSPHSEELAYMYARQAAGIMTPKYDVEPGTHGKEAFLVSDVFMVGNDATRPMIAVYDANQEEPSPILFYLSNSHGTWRALLSKVSDRDGSWYAKCMFGVENSVDAPLYFQKLFSQILANNEQAPFMQGAALDTVVPNLSLPLERKENTQNNKLLAAEIAERIMTAAGVARYQNVITWEEDPQKAEKKLFNSRLRPDFSNPTDSWVINSPLYGRIYATTYPSKDGKVIYVVNEIDNDGHPLRWVGSAHVADAAVTPIGIPDTFTLNDPRATTPPRDHEGEGYTEHAERSPFDNFAVRSIAAYKARANKGTPKPN